MSTETQMTSSVPAHFISAWANFLMLWNMEFCWHGEITNIPFVIHSIWRCGYKQRLRGSFPTAIVCMFSEADWLTLDSFTEPMISWAKPRCTGLNATLQIIKNQLENWPGASALCPKEVGRGHAEQAAKHSSPNWGDLLGQPEDSSRFWVLRKGLWQSVTAETSTTYSTEVRVPTPQSPWVGTQFCEQF